MKGKLKNLSFAIHCLFSGEDYLRHITNGAVSRDSVGKYSDASEDKMNGKKDMRNIRSDINKVIKAGYGNFATR